MSVNRLSDYLTISARLRSTPVVSYRNDQERFLADRRTQQAVIMSLVIIGEAATKIMDRHADFVLAQPDVPWRSMRDAQPYRARLFRYQSGCSLGNRADGVAGAAGRLAGTGRTFLTRLYLLTRLYPTLLSCSIAAGFSSVEMSCVIGSSLAIARSRRRMILPERVLGRLPA